MITSRNKYSEVPVIFVLSLIIFLEDISSDCLIEFGVNSSFLDLYFSSLLWVDNVNWPIFIYNTPNLLGIIKL